MHMGPKGLAYQDIRLLRGRSRPQTKSSTCFLSQTLTMSRNVLTSRCIVLFGIFLSGYAFLNGSRTAANDFDAK
jgi:hypothetical protein